jgi:hypothetical protein
MNKNTNIVNELAIIIPIEAKCFFCKNGYKKNTNSIPKKDIMDVEVLSNASVNRLNNGSK